MLCFVRALLFYYINNRSIIYHINPFMIKVSHTNKKRRDTIAKSPGPSLKCCKMYVKCKMKALISMQLEIKMV